MQKNKAKNNKRKIANRARRIVSKKYFSSKAIPYQTGAAKRGEVLPFGLKNINGVSEDGMAFLKCAFAPPDFQFDNAKGIPDSLSDRRLVKRHRLVQPFQFAAGRDYYFIQLPVPGYSYFMASVAAGTPILAATQFAGNPYSDYTTLFGIAPGREADVVDRFRFVSSCFELIPTANQMTWSGNIQAWKCEVHMAGAATAVTGNLVYTLSGIQSTNATNPDCFIAPFDKGCYTQAFKTGPTFEWNPIIENLATLPIAPTANDFGQLVPTGVATSIPGFGYMDCTVVKVSGITANESAIIKTWACVEYSPLVNSVLYEYAHGGPCEDQLALKLYNVIAAKIPIGVAFDENAGMWERIMNIIRSVTKLGSALPGQYGMGFAGANMLAEAVAGLTI